MTLHYMNQLTENYCLLLKALRHDENDFVAQMERLGCLNPFNLSPDRCCANRDRSITVIY